MEIQYPHNTNNKWRPVVFILIAVLLFGGLSLFYQHKVDRQGVYLIATVESATTAKNGYRCQVKYRYNGKDYSAFVVSYDGSEKAGEYYYIKVLPNDPEMADFQSGKKVPDCVLQSPAPEDGWREIPTCN